MKFPTFSLRIAIVLFLHSTDKLAQLQYREKNLSQSLTWLPKSTTMKMRTLSLLATLASRSSSTNIRSSM
jgi:hypothetical protein